MTQPLRKVPADELGKRISEWLVDTDNRRGARAELRRIQDPGEANLCREAWRFHAQFGDLELQTNAQLIAQAAGLLIHFRGHLPGASLAARMAESDKGRPRVSPRRFRRLLDADQDQFFSGMRRMIPLLERQGNLVDLLLAYVDWNDITRQRWARDYFQTLEKPSK